MERPWADVPAEILSLVLSKLFGKDDPVFRAVCRGWNSTPTPQTKHINDSVSQIVKHPFLLRYRRTNCCDSSSSSSSSSSYCELYSPAYSKTYLIEASPTLGDAQIHHSNFGWLLLSRQGKFFFLEPSTGNTVFLPKNVDSSFTGFNVMSFSAPPTSHDCVVVCVRNQFPAKYSVYISFIRRGDSEWRNHTFGFVHGGHPNKVRLDLSRKRLAERRSLNKWSVNANWCKFKTIMCRGHFWWSNYWSAPVFHKGAFYCLGQQGRLGVFDPWKDKRKKMWRVIDVAGRRGAFYTTTLGFNPSYLMESSCRGGELISVVVGLDGRSTGAFKFNHDLKLWISLGDLGDQVAFLSHTSSMVVPCHELQVKGLENTLHFARFDDSICNVFYSLKTRKFHSFKDGYTSDHLGDGDTGHRLNCTWMVPNSRNKKSHQQQQKRLDWIDPVLGEQNNETETPLGIVRPFSSIICDLHFLQPSKSKQLQQLGDRHRMMEQKQMVPKGRPWVILRHDNDKQEEKEAYTLLDLANLTFHSGNSMVASLSLGGKKVYGGTNGRELVVMDLGSGDCALLNTLTLVMDPLPTWQLSVVDFTNCHCVVHLLPGDNSRYAVTVFGVDESSSDYNYVVAFCRVGDKNWTIHMRMPYICKAVAYQDKIYGIGSIEQFTGFKLIEMESHPENGRVEVVETIKLPNYIPMGSMYPGEYLVESCGELLVFRAFVKLCEVMGDVIMEVRAYRMDLKTRRWEEMEDLGDRAFFMCGNIGNFGCCASILGFPPNTIYFIGIHNGGIVRYNYGNHSIATVLWCKDKVDGCSVHGLVMF